MSLEEALLAHWAATEPLATLLPVEAVSLGRGWRAALPYATLRRVRGRTLVRTNAGRAAAECLVRIRLWHDEAGAGQTAAAAVVAAFDGGTVALADPAGVCRLALLNDSAAQHPEGPWQFHFTFRAVISRFAASTT